MPNIKLDSYYISDTYAGVLEGLPTPEEICKSITRYADKIFGERKKIIHKPWINNIKFIPKRCCMAYLCERNPNFDDPDGWELLVIWFQDKDPIDPLKDALTVVETNGSWDKLKNPYWY